MSDDRVYADSIVRFAHSPPPLPAGEACRFYNRGLKTGPMDTRQHAGFVFNQNRTRAAVNKHPRKVWDARL